MQRFVKSKIALIATLSLAGSAMAQNIGPSTLVRPYIVPTRSGVSTTSILTVGDSIGGYRMVGIPDGLGAIDGPGNSLTLTMNHELGGTAGTVRASGFTGAFVSRWEIDKTTLSVNNGRDFNTSPADVYWSSQPARAISRFCSGDLAAPGAYSFGNLGTTARIHMNGEESGNEGTAWAHIVTGSAANTSWELPALGKFSWENSVANPYSQQKTIVMGTDDSTPGQVYMYVGNKISTGNDIERAGLTNGNLFGIRVTGTATEQRSTPINGTFDTYSLGDVSGLTGAQVQANSTANSVTEFLRPEDSAWDPRPGHENNFYFVTTDRFNSPSQVGRSRLYRLSFNDIANPEAGGTITALLDGTEGGNMFDNITVDSHGRILLQEDIGNADPLGKIWLYDTTTGNFGQIAQHDPGFFGVPAGPEFLTRDEESSGIIDAKDLLGDGWFLLDVQAHYGIPGELVEGGQLLAMYVDPSITPEPTTIALLLIGGLPLLRRRR